MNTLNLATKNTTDFRVLNNGKAYISQTKVAVLCGVSQHAISQFVTKTHDTLIVNEFSQLDAKSLELVIGHYAFDSQRTNDVARTNYRLLAQAGAKAYIYHEAGYVISAKPKESALPQTYIAALKELIVKEEALEKTQGELKGANARQIKERVLSIQDTCQDIRNQHPELGITERRMIKLLRVNKMIYSHSTKPLVRQNKTIGFTLSSGGDGYGNKITYVKTEFKTNFNTWVMENCGTPKTPKVKIPPPPPKKEAHPNDLFYYFQAMCEPEEYTRSQLHSFGFSDEMIARDNRMSKTPF